MSSVHTEICRPVAKQLRLSMFLASLAQLIKLTIWLLMIYLIDVARNYAQASQSAVLFGGVFALFALTVLYYTFKIKAHDQSHYAAFRLEQILRRRLSHKISRLPLGEVQNIGSGALTKVLLDDVHELHTFVADAPPLKAEAFSTPVLVLIALFWLDWRFASAVLIFVLVVLGVLQILFRRGKLFRRQYGQALAQINSAVIEYVQGMSTVRAFDAGQRSFGRFQRALANFRQIMHDWLARVGFSTRLARALFTPMPMMLFLLFIGAYWHAQNQLSTFTLFAFLLLAAGLIETMHPYMGLFHLLEKSRAAIERINEIEALNSLPLTQSPQFPQTFDIRFEQVSFRYAKQQQPALTDVDLFVPAGSFTVVVGQSGSGKTSLLNLLLRFWDVERGNIKIGGVDIRDIEPNWLLQQCSVVFQDNYLFSGTIAENIAFGIQDIDEAQIITAARQAYIHDFIMSLPQGYQTEVGERGQLLSGGQKQRLTIARAFLQNRPILLLDEPTAFSDAENEANLLQAFNALMQHKTVLMIAHRLSVAPRADQVIYMQQGKIIAQGKHSLLLSESESYRQLWENYQQTQQWTLENH
ncbi:ABC transporter ATP-binding protein [Aggregatibacter segnis]|uniref:ABC transporter ATP-binding protein n=1 Tax=Aggregatibacter segnis TaxID=739 RepID=UPI0028E281D4|nr:ABC transporter ATP-binding protein [Aggregatibacter segnis]